MARLDAQEIASRAAGVRLLLLDVDGVLTDGTVAIGSDGHEAKSFFIRDGAGLVLAQRAGIRVGLLSGRPSGATSRRAEELGITLVVQDGGDKHAHFRAVLAQTGITSAEVAYMGDDLLDLPVLAEAAVAAAPADAAPEVLAAAHWVSRFPGGRGAVRELAELLLRARAQWDDLVAGLARK